MKVSFIATTFNEEKTIEGFLKSLFSQTLLPDEIIIVDGGSSDRTVAKIKDKKLKIKNYRGEFKVIVKKGNRAVGRNEAVRRSNGDIIVCSDAGCILDRNWLENIIHPFKNLSVDVVAGYYKGAAKTVFEKCLIPYVLVMPDKADPNNFLPAARSMAFKKRVWEKIGGFEEQYSHNEDYVFAKKLKQIEATVVFEKKAIVYWIPRKNIFDAFVMFFRFAYGDAEAGIARPKVILLFLRYSAGILLLIIAVLYKSLASFYLLFLLGGFYLVWTVDKNYHYVKEKEAIFILPLIQLAADAAVLIGSTTGAVRKLTSKYLYHFKAG